MGCKKEEEEENQKVDSRKKCNVSEKKKVGRVRCKSIFSEGDVAHYVSQKLRKGKNKSDFNILKWYVIAGSTVESRVGH